MALSVDDASVQAFNILEDFDEIIENVLNHLPMKSLHCCACVSRKWHSTVTRLKRARKQNGWLLYNRDGDFSDIDSCVGERLEVLSSEPRYALLFTSTDLLHDMVAVRSKSSAVTTRYPRASKLEKMAIPDYLQRVLPPGCQVMGVSTDGVVGTSCASSTCQELENTRAFSCLLLPQTCNLELYHFYVGSNISDLLGDADISADSVSPDPQQLASVTGIPEDKEPKLVLLFHADRFLSDQESDLGCALLERYTNLVVAGGYVDGLIPDGITEEDEPFGMGIAFCGDHLKVASVILQPSIRTKEEVKRVLQRLQDTHIPVKNSFAFMFACIGRGCHHYQESNVEAKVFKLLFPSVPLFGFFGNGEIGHNYLPDYSSQPEVNGATEETGNVKEKGHVQEMYHSYTTIFVLLSPGG